MVQGEEEIQPPTETEEVNGSENPRNSREHLTHQKHKEDVEISSEWSEEISMNGTGKSSHLRELLKKHKIEEQEEKADEEGGVNLHDPIGFNETSNSPRPARPRPITLYHRSLFKFKLSCRPPAASGAHNATPSPPQSFLSRQVQDSHQTADKLWWKTAMRTTKLLLRSLSSPVQRWYRTSAECCAAGLNYRGFVHANSASRNTGINKRRPRDGERENIGDYFAAPLNSVSEARPMDCSRDQCGWSQEYSMISPAMFSWESTPTNYDHSNHQLLQRDHHHPAQSTVSTFTATTELFYSSNLMTPYEIHYSFRRTFNLDDTKSCSGVDI